MHIFSKVAEDEGEEIPDFVQTVRSNRRSYVKENQVGQNSKLMISLDEVKESYFSWNLLCFLHLMTWQTPMMHTRRT